MDVNIKADLPEERPTLADDPRNPMQVDYGADDDDDDASSAQPEVAQSEERIPTGATPDGIAVRAAGALLGSQTFHGDQAPEMTQHDGKVGTNFPEYNPWHHLPNKICSRTTK